MISHKLRIARDVLAEARERRRVRRQIAAWGLATILIGGGVFYGIYRLRQPPPKPAVVRPIDSVKPAVTQTAVGSVEVSMLPGTLRVKLPPGFAGKSVLGFLLSPGNTELRDGNHWHSFVPVEDTVPGNGILHFEAPKDLEKAPGCDWPKASRRIFVVFDTAEAAKAMDGQVVFKNVRPEEFQRVLLFLEISPEGVVEVRRPNAGMEELRLGLDFCKIMFP